MPGPPLASTLGITSATHAVILRGRHTVDADVPTFEPLGDEFARDARASILIDATPSPTSGELVILGDHYTRAGEVIRWGTTELMVDPATFEVLRLRA